VKHPQRPKTQLSRESRLESRLHQAPLQVPHVGIIIQDYVTTTPMRPQPSRNLVSALLLKNPLT
jgi:hypothetical protein